MDKRNTGSEKLWQGKQIYPSAIWHGDGFNGRIHSVFHKVVNMLTENGMLVALIQEDCEPFPATMVLDKNTNFASWHLKEGQPVCYRDMFLIIGNENKICVDFQHALPSKKLVIPKKCQAVSGKMLSSICHLTKVYGNKSSLFDAVFEGKQSDELGELFRCRVQKIVQCSEKWSAYSVHKMYQAICDITGLGVGLTPSGDDFLNGFFLSAYYLRAKWREAFPFADYIRQAEKDTGAVSIAMLKNAWNGEARYSLVDLFTALEKDDWQKGKKAVHGVLAYGSTSGTDTMCGVLAGLAAGFEGRFL